MNRMYFLIGLICDLTRLGGFTGLQHLSALMENEFWPSRSVFPSSCPRLQSSSCQTWPRDQMTITHTDDTLTQRHTDLQLNTADQHADASSEHHWKHSILQHCITLDTSFVDRALWINNLINTAFSSSLFACVALRQSKTFHECKII